MIAVYTITNYSRLLIGKSRTIPKEPVWYCNVPFGQRTGIAKKLRVMCEITKVNASDCQWRYLVEHNVELQISGKQNKLH